MEHAKKKRKENKFGMRLLGFLTLLAILYISIGLLTRDDTSTVGVTVMLVGEEKENISQLTEQTVEIKLNELQTEFSERQQTVKIGNETFNLSNEDLGISLDIETPLETVRQSGRHWGVLNWPGRIVSNVEETTIELTVLQDPVLFENQISALAKDYYVEPTEPEIREIKDADGNVESWEYIPGEKGTVVNYKMLASLKTEIHKNSLNSYKPLALNFELEDVEAEQSAVWEEAVMQANVITDNELLLEAEGTTVTRFFDRNELRSWVALNTKTGDLVFNEEAFKEEAIRKLETFRSESNSPKFSITETNEMLETIEVEQPAETGTETPPADVEQVVVQEAGLPLFDESGNLVGALTQEGTQGWEVDEEEALQLITDALYNNDDKVLLPRTKTEKGLELGENALTLGITEEISSFTTNHSCCQNRVENIHRIADLTKGIVIPPGGRFSVNEFIGVRTKNNGFVADGAISNGKLVDQVGGGISQHNALSKKNYA